MSIQEFQLKTTQGVTATVKVEPAAAGKGKRYSLAATLPNFPGYRLLVQRGDDLLQPDRFLVAHLNGDGVRPANITILDLEYDPAKGTACINAVGPAREGYPHPSVFLTTDNGKPFVCHDARLWEIVRPLVEDFAGWCADQN